MTVQIGSILSDLSGLLGDLRSRHRPLLALDTFTPSGRALFGMLGACQDGHALSAKSVLNPNKLDKLGFGCINYPWNSHRCPLSGHQRS